MCSTKKTVTYCCTLGIPASGDGFVKLGQFPSGVDQNGQISIWLQNKGNLKTRESKDKRAGHTGQEKSILDILVKKSNESPAKVDINLHMTQMKPGVTEETKSLDNWKTYCYFRDWAVAACSPNSLHEIIMKITWNISEFPNLCLKISNFLMNETLSDVKIIIGNEKLFAHKLVLGAASPVMLTMLTSPMKEVTENCIEIKDVPVDVMKAILTLLYTGNDGDFDKTEMALKALMAAEKYDMKELKDLCEQKLLKNLNAGNALQVLDVAETHQSETLVNESMKFIVSHKKEIVRSEYFEEFCIRKPLLMMKFIKIVVDNGDSSFSAANSMYFIME